MLHFFDYSCQANQKNASSSWWRGNPSQLHAIKLPFGLIFQQSWESSLHFWSFYTFISSFGSNHILEAAFMARSYLPSKVSDLVSIWRNNLSKVYDSHTKILFMGLFLFDDFCIVLGKQSISYMFSETVKSKHWSVPT